MTNKERLVSFLYILMRDHLPSGVVEEIMLRHVEISVTGVEYSNPHLFAHAQELEARINLDQIRIK